jgi:DNA-binding response OmpR family regulator
MMKRILIVEDDAALARVLRDNLTFEGFHVECISDGNLVLGKAREMPPDLVLLDLMLPGCDGFELLGPLRQWGIPTIVLTARGQKADKLRGFHLGADDYVTKPFELEELLARVHAVLRRSAPELDELVLGNVRVHFRTKTASQGQRAIHLTHREFELLRYMAEHQSRVVYRAELLRDVWGYPDAPLTRSVDHAIARLRKKVEPGGRYPSFIETVHGDGYCLNLDAGEGSARRRP